MSMMKEIEKFMNASQTSINYRVVNVGGNYLYLEGIKSVVDLSEIKMQFQLKNTLLEVTGQGLKIKYLDKSTCTITGQISAVVTR